MNKILSVLSISVLCIFCSDYLLAQDYTLNPEKDNTIFSEGPYSNGKGDYLFAGFTVHGPERRALLKFNLTSIAPDDSVVSAELTLYMSKTIADNRTVYLHRILNEWGEGSSDALYEEGAGADATPGSATWDDAFYDSIAWETAGGDYVSDASDSTDVGQVGLYTWNGNGLVIDLNDWLEDSTLNHGWLLRTASSTVSAKRFNSLENSEHPPLLTISTMKKTPVWISTHNLLSNFTVYPNPSHGKFLIKGTSGSYNTTIRVYNITGELIMDIEFQNQNYSHFNHIITIEEKGIYIIEINDSNYKKVTVY